jgi:hypothetical protein
MFNIMQILWEGNANELFGDEHIERVSLDVDRVFRIFHAGDAVPAGTYAYQHLLWSFVGGCVGPDSNSVVCDAYRGVHLCVKTGTE